jgi:transposase
MSQEPPIPAELWAQVPPAAQAALLTLLASYEQRLSQLQEQVNHLQHQLGLNSTNSSRPPSSDPPAVKRAPPRTRSGKTKGAQPGLPRQQRPPLPPDQTLHCKPTHCRRCQHPLAGDDPQPLRHQVIELPKIEPEVTDYLRHRLTCPQCGTTTCAPLPPGVPAGEYGPRLQAHLALFSGDYRLSKRHIERLCDDVFGVPICPGQVCALEQQTAGTLEPVVAELREYARQQPANIDETSWRQGGRRAWLWVVVTAAVTVFHLALARSAKIAKELLGAAGRWVVTSDRYSAYNWLPVRLRQLCWAHLVRDFQAMVDRNNVGKAIGAELLYWAGCLFDWWYRVRDGTLSRSTFQKYVSIIRPCVREELERGSVCGCAKTAGVCKEVLKVERALWTFVRVEGIEPTNNAAERTLRHAVLWRKQSYGTDSEAGSVFVANVLSVVATCRQQGRNVLDYLTACCTAAIRGVKPPSLLPQQSK